MNPRQDYRDGMYQQTGKGNRPLGASNMDQTAAIRSGLLGWWLSLTAPPRPLGLVPVAERERIRKAELTSVSMLAVFVFLVTLVSNSLADPSTGEAVGTMALGLVLAALLNRTGRTRVAAWLVPTLLMLLIMAAIVQAKGGLRLIWLPAYDLFVLPIFLTSLIADRRSPWVFATIAITFIIGDFTLQPHAHITTANANGFDDIAYETNIFSWWGMVNRHVALAFFAGFFGWLGATSVDSAIRRADRAEELAGLEHAVAEQRRQLEVGAQQLLETHVRVANGDFAARAPVVQDNILWQVAASLNNLLARLQKSAQSDHQLRRTEDELRRLAGAIDDAQAGRRPIWPAPTGTAADLIIERITGRSRQAQPAPLMGPSPQLSPQNSRHFPAQPPFSQSPWSPQMPPSAPSMPSQMPSQMPPPAPSTQGQMPAGAPFGPGWVNSGPLAPGSPQQPNAQYPQQPNAQYPQQPNAQYPPQPPAQRPQQGQEPAESAEPDNPWFAPPESEPPSW